ncbi:lipopolysaccharide assembly protein LapB [Actinoplanes sp. L3-i22]|uniref:tetratricopeptide repeat protein n=1 Tax=Actinoplanes sp. L3-i22 TaxID=2836373 RepID=UPI001C768B43|nr:tetratricopeptide repeat protein [Actinoplanes sp. L3-i22]BCY08915.1 hypothetical protein L3i22_040030 [Actinoplanes sp. L3-i22]
MEGQAHLRLTIPLAPYASSGEAFFSGARAGSPAGDDEILTELQRRAEAAGDSAAAAHYAALALLRSGRTPQAVSILQQLIAAFPDVDGYRVSLSVAYVLLGELDLGESQLNEVARTSADPGVLADVRARLADLSADRRRMQVEAKQAYLQVAVLRKRVREGTASQEQFLLLARHLVAVAAGGSGESGWDEATGLLTSAAERFPDDVRFLELLATCYLSQSDDERLDPLISQIERLSPESPMLPRLKALFQGRKMEDGPILGPSEPEAEAWLQQAVEGRPSAESAVQELGRLANRFPGNLQYRVFYALALFVRGHGDEAVRQADALAPLVGRDYIGNYNVGQIYTFCGQPVKGRRHLEIALAVAQTDGDRADASEMLATSQKLFPE